MLFDLDRGLWQLACRSSSGRFVLFTDELQGSRLLDSSDAAAATGAAWVDLSTEAFGEWCWEFCRMVGGEGDRGGGCLSISCRCPGSVPVDICDWKWLQRRKLVLKALLQM